MTMNFDKMETYHGYVRTPADAIKLFEACRLGLLPRVQRRLSEKERQSIRSGSVFVWDEREAGMRRWTDGKSWSASRVSGSFLTYREMEGKRGGGFGGNGNNGSSSNHARRGGAGKTPDSGRGSDEDQEDGEPEGYRYKADGLMKQSFSITTSTGQHLHLISYYSRPQSGQPELSLPSTDPSLRNVVPMKGMYPESSMGETNQTPALTRVPMQQPYMMAQHPHHPHHPYHPPPGYGHPPYGWPPSPAATPPYAHYAPIPYPQATAPPLSGQPPGPPPPHHAQHQLPPPHMAAHHHPQVHPQPPHLHYTHYGPPPPHPYDRPATLPPFQGALAGRHSPPRRFPSPTPPPNSAGASASSAARSDQGSLLPAPSSTSSQTRPTTATATASPPTRPSSSSSPRSTHAAENVNSQKKSSLSALLHPTNADQEEGSSNSSPKIKSASGGLPPPSNLDKFDLNQDQKALRMLDRKFCL